jgi:ankyrin repeat protein
MGASLCNMHVRSDSQKEVCEALKKVITIRAYVSPAEEGWVSVFDEVANSMDQEEALRLGKELSAVLKTAVFIGEIFHSDVMMYYLFHDGNQLDFYNSTPDYFGKEDKDEFEKTKGNPELLCSYANASIKPLEVQLILARKPATERENEPMEYLLAEERLEALFSVLQIKNNYAHIGFHDFFDEGIRELINNKSKFKLVNRRGALKKIEELFASIEGGDLEKIKQLIKSGVSPNTKTNDRLRTPALRQAIKKRDIAIVKYLIDAGANLSDVYFSETWGNIELVTLLIEAGANINDGLLAACRQDDLDIIKLFLEKGANINYVNEDGRTPLYVVVDSHIFYQKSSYDQSYEEGIRKRLEVVRFLLEKGADLNKIFQIHYHVPDQIKSYTILMATVNPELAWILLRFGATINAVNDSGSSALIYHASHANKEMVIFLIKHDADLTIKNKSGHTALDIARLQLAEWKELGTPEVYLRKHQEIIDLLTMAERGIEPEL